MNERNQGYLSKYFENSIKKAKKNLLKSYNYKKFIQDDYDILNAYFIDKLMLEDSKHLYISSLGKQDNVNYYIPVFLSVAASTFLKNYCNDSIPENMYKEGVVLQDKKGVQYQIVEVLEDRFKLSYSPKGGGSGTKFVKGKELNNFIITTIKERRERRSAIKFTNYKNCLMDLFSVDDVPSMFYYKSVIIAEKKTFLDQLNICSTDKYNYKRIIPFQWITKNGANYKTSKYLDIDPMLYLCPDYETVRDHLYDNNLNIDSITFIGRNKYINDISHIKRDIRQGILKKAIFIGSELNESIDGLLKWNWTEPEAEYYINKNHGKLQAIEIDSSQFERAFKSHIELIREIEDEFLINLNYLVENSYSILSLTPSVKSSRIINQINYDKVRITEKIDTVMNERLCSIDGVDLKSLDDLHKSINKVFSEMTCDKFIKLIISDRIDILVVPSYMKTIWSEALKECEHMADTRCISWREFKTLENKSGRDLYVYFISIFGHQEKPYFVVKHLQNNVNNVNVNLILYSIEKEIFNSIQKNIWESYYKEYESDDRAKLINLRPQKDIDSNYISNIVNKDYDIFFSTGSFLISDETEEVFFKISFDDNTNIILEGSKSVIIENQNNNFEKMRISQLSQGDSIRIYENTDRSKLFKIACENDTEGRFEKIKEFSKIWKFALINYYNSKKSATYKYSDLLKELINNGAKIQIVTLKNWLNKDHESLFPSKAENIRAVLKTTNDICLKNKLENIIKYRSIYRSIMISLGHNLSDELMDYVQSNKKNKGELLKEFSDNQIDSFVKRTAPTKTIKRIEIIRGDNE